MNLSQTKLVGLTMELDLKVREYNILCKKLEEFKKEDIDPNDIKLIELRDQFQKNHDEIYEINNQLRMLKNQENNNIIKNKELFLKKETKNYKKNNENTVNNKQMITAENKKELFITKILKKIIDFFKK